MKLGLIVFANDSGLGNQTRRLTYLLKPDRLLVIDSSGFSNKAKDQVQHFDWYDQFTGYKVFGFPNNRDINTFLGGLTHVLVCENPLNFHLMSEAKRRGIKVFIQSNYEFCDHLNNTIELPEKFLMPSYWKIKEMKDRFGEDRVEYLPPPVDAGEFKQAADDNFNRPSEVTPHFLHIVGTLAANDRNGTMDLLQALPYCKTDFRLTIKSQDALPQAYIINDRRIRYQIGNEKLQYKLYMGFDGLILPRRYGGLSLTTNEALMCGMPVIMPDISPNNELLPKKWLVPAHKKGEFFTRTMIDIYEVKPQDLADKIDWLAETRLLTEKTDAFELGFTEFSSSRLAEGYSKLWSQ
jgi:glycosyltransferase involved in cell wall biosynthesis